MKNLFKRGLSLIILILTIVTLCITAFAYEGDIYDGITRVGSWRLEGSVLTLYGTIPDSFSFRGWVNNVELAPLVRVVRFGENVTSVPGRLLQYCKNVQEFYIPENVQFIGCPLSGEVYIFSRTVTIGGIAQTSTVYCYAGSTAEAYAKNHDIAYVIMCEEHTPELRRVSEPTCDSMGYSGDEYCSVCGIFLNRGTDIPALGHDYITVNEKAPTCFEDGYSGDCVCSRCGDVKVVGHVLQSSGHSWGSWTISATPTCTEVGYSIRACDKCSATERREIDALGHMWDDGVITKESTASSTGIKLFTCEVCGETKTEIIPKNDPSTPHDHTYSEIVTAPTCLEQGYTTYKCTFCGDSYIDNYTAALGHDYKISITKPTCLRQGSTTHTCKRCGYEYIDSFVKALGHDFGADELEKTCIRCGAINPEAVSIEFSDVKADAYYAPAVSWAVANNITTGTSSTTFSPENGCTRGQVVTFLWRAAGQPEPTLRKNPFKDVKKDDYFYKAVMWAVKNGITSGTSANTFSPNDTCTRGQIVTFLWRASGKPKPSGSSNPFRDVKKSDYYYDAVLWAVKNNVTSGTSKTTYSPKDTCTRGQIVTFLYRNAVK